MKEIERTIVPIMGNGKWEWPARSLCWDGNELIDWAGGARYRLDHTVIPPNVRYPFSFDQAVTSPDGQYIALVERLGTKGLLLKNGTIIREINRSYYYARDYEYPMTFLTLPDNRTALAHCPDKYCKIEIEDVESAKRLTARDTAPIDFFHSRLASSRTSKYLLSAGWIWHPFNDVRVYNIGQVLLEPSQLDQISLNYRAFARPGVGVNNAAFWGEDNLIITTNNETYDPSDIDECDRYLMQHDCIGVYDLGSNCLVSQASLEEPAGRIMPLGSFVVGFYRYPRLIDLATGRIVQRWPELTTGEQNSSIVLDDKKLPPIALDPDNNRFAVASPECVTIIQLG